MLAGMLVLLATSSFGIVVTPDGGIYVSVARHLLAGRGWVAFSGEPFVHWPPLYPAVLAVPGLVGVDPLAAAPFVHAGLVGLTVAVVLGWLRRQSVRGAVVGWTAAALVFGKPLLFVGTRALSEGLFILLATAALVDLSAWQEQCRPQRLVRAACWAGAAFLTRYVGVSLVLAGAAVVLTTPSPLRRKIARAAMFALIATGPAVLWMARNALLVGEPTGERVPSMYGPAAVVGMLVDAASQLFAPDEVPALLRMTGLVGVLCGAGWVLTQQERGAARAGPWVAFALAFAGVLALVRSLFASDVLNVRLAAPLYVPLVVLAALAFDAWSRAGDHARLRRLAGVLAVAWLAFPGAYAVRLVYLGHTEGSGGYASARWRASPLVAYLRDADLDGRLVANEATPIYLHTGRPARWLPMAHRTSPDRDRDELRSLAREVSTDPGAVYLVWFDAVECDDAYEACPFGPGDLEAVLRLVPVHTAADGRVYRLLPRSDR